MPLTPRPRASGALMSLVSLFILNMMLMAAAVRRRRMDAAASTRVRGAEEGLTCARRATPPLCAMMKRERSAPYEQPRTGAEQRAPG